MSDSFSDVWGRTHSLAQMARRTQIDPRLLKTWACDGVLTASGRRIRLPATEKNLQLRSSFRAYNDFAARVFDGNHPGAQVA